MYKLLIILRYLRRKLTPMFAVLAVTLCTAMVIIVISIMGGFLENMRHAAQTLEGDVIIQGDMTGFPHYQELITQIEKMPKVKAAAATINSYGLLNLEDGLHTVEIMGIDPEAMDKVVGFRQTLFWTPEKIRESLDRHAPPADASDIAKRNYQLQREFLEKLNLADMAMKLQAPPEWSPRPRNDSEQPDATREVKPAPAIVPGIHVGGSNIRDEKGQYDFHNNRTISSAATLTVVPVTKSGGLLEPAARKLIVVNEFKSGLYAIDANRVYVPLGLLQEMLRMDAHADVDPETGATTGKMNPGRVTGIVVKGVPGTDVNALRDGIYQQVKTFVSSHPDTLIYRVETWEEKHSTFLGAVLKEKFLVTILFSFISIVAIVMIAVIFYMIVLEKTRDIGILRAIGASWPGIMSIFLGYGLAVGIVGAGLGFALAAAIVKNINAIQDFLTRFFGLTIWNPEVYYFDQIPSQMNPVEVTVILIVAVIASVLGAIVPAILAARMNPVEALRYE